MTKIDVIGIKEDEATLDFLLNDVSLNDCTLFLDIPQEWIDDLSLS